MNKSPLVSVIIPTYNRAGIIGRTIDNILEQTYRNLELIVVDDGSTDDTQARLKAYGDRIRVIQQNNAGPGAARNRGAEAAQGDIIAFQDSDDLWKPTKLERQVALLERDRSLPCCLCNVLMRVVDGKSYTSFEHSLIKLEREEGLWLNVLDVLATRFVLFNQAAAIRRDAFERIGGFPEDLRYMEDYDLPLRLAMEGSWAFIREPLVVYGEGSPASFSEEAKKNASALKQCELRVYERMLARASGSRYANARRGLRRRLAITRRQLSALELQKNGSLISRYLGNCIALVDRFRMGLFRRSPWFPQALTISTTDVRPCPRT
jgi:glycosyltransferase involved in cell wall biosynthesis